MTPVPESARFEPGEEQDGAGREAGGGPGRELDLQVAGRDDDQRVPPLGGIERAGLVDREEPHLQPGRQALPEQREVAATHRRHS